MIRRIIVSRSRMVVSLKSFHRRLNVGNKLPSHRVTVEDIADSQPQKCHEGGGCEAAPAPAKCVLLELCMVHPKDVLALRWKSKFL